jgi:hypothetical protein
MREPGRFPPKLGPPPSKQALSLPTICPARSFHTRRLWVHRLEAILPGVFHIPFAIVYCSHPAKHFKPLPRDSTRAGAEIRFSLDR